MTSPLTTTRRRLLAATAASVAGAGLGLQPSPAKAKEGAAATRFAMITDTHQDLDKPERTADLARVMEHIAGRDPAFVVNCGDITDYGVEGQFAAYRSTIPASLSDRVHQVPGNHEEQWNADAFAAYRRNFGPTHHSFDAAGLHVVGMDPMVSQEWNWYFGDDLLDWIDRDLRQVPPGTPIVMFNHFPLGNRWHFVMDGEDFLHVIEPYQVRLLLAGHIHHDSGGRFNGVTQVVGDATYQGPDYYWFQRRTDEGGDRLDVHKVVLPPGGDLVETPVTTVPLDTPGPGGDLGPFRTHQRVRRDAVTVTLTAPAAVSVAYAQVYPQGAKAKALQRLEPVDGHRWTGAVDITDLPPGRHRMVLRTADGQGIVYDDMQGFTIPSGATRVAWTHRLHGRIQGDLAVAGDLVVAASVQGDVAAIRVSERSAQPVWSRHVAPVYKGAALSADAGLAMVGSTDHAVRALRLDRGREVWRRDLGAPVMCDLTLTRIDGHERMLTAAGSTAYCLDLDGTIRWTADLGGIATGAFGCDGQRVYLGCGDGDAYALSATDGSVLWRTSCTDQTGDYGRLIHGPWAARIRLLDGSGVIVTTFDGVLRLDPGTGAVDWSVAGLHRTLYTPPTITRHGIMVFDGKDGTAHLLDPASGATLWTDDTLPRSFGAAPIASPDPDVYWMAANNGLLTKIDVAARTVTPVLQLSTAWSTSTAVSVTSAHGGAVLVAAAKDGRLRGVSGLARV